MTFPSIVGASQQKRSSKPMIIKVNYASSFTVTIPTNIYSGTYNYIIDWGDGYVSPVITSGNSADRIHTYASGGTYTIKMIGVMSHFIVQNAATIKSYLIEVVNWGRTGLVAVDFYGCTRLTACHGTLDVSKLNSLRLLFASCNVLTTIDGIADWDTSNVTNMDRTFVNCTILPNVDVSRWNTGKVTGMTETFGFCAAMTTIPVDNWDVSKVTNFSFMFRNCTSLTTLNLNNWRFHTTSNVNLSYLFWQCGSVSSIGTDLSGWNTTKITNLECAFISLKVTSFPGIGSWDVSNNVSLYGTFANCINLTSLDVGPWNVGKVTNFGDISYGTFAGCTNLTSLALDDWRFSTTSNINFVGVFRGCSKLTRIATTTLAGWNTTKFTSIWWMFYGCSKLDDLTGIADWDTSNVTVMDGAFYGCSSLTSLDLSAWNVTNCTNFGSAPSYVGMFNGCSGLTSLNVSGWTLNTTSNVTMRGMFANCSSLTSLSFSGWNTSKVITFTQFLYRCYALTTCDVSVLNTSSCTDFPSMFYDCRALTTINISGWDMSKITGVGLSVTTGMFANCYALTSLTVPASLPRVDDLFAANVLAITVYNFYPATAPTVSGTPFSNYAKPLHVPVSNSGYDVAPWTNTAIFSSIINDL